MFCIPVNAERDKTLIVFGNEVYNGTWNWSGFLWVTYGAIGFAVLYHILFARFIVKDDSEKNS